MDFSLTDDQQLLRDTADQAARARVPAGARARAHRRPVACTSRCGDTSASTPRSAPGPRPTCASSSSRPATRPRPDRSSRPRCSRRSSAATATTTGTVAFLDDPMNPFVLEADRVEQHRGRSGPARASRCVDAADVARSAAVRRAPSTSRAALFQLDAVDLDARLRSRSTPRRLRRVARPRARVDRGRDGRHRAAHLRHGARVREGAQAVRPADRLVPGDPAQARRHVARARSVRPRRCSTRR